MWNLTLKRILRSPLPALGVLVFTAVLTIVLCTLHQSGIEAQEHYGEIYHEIDVTCTITNLTGTNSDGLDLPNWIIDLFTGYLDWVSSDVTSMVENVQIKSIQRLTEPLQEYTLVGITSLEMAQELWPDNGCTIFWNEGFDESVFEKDELVCIIPEKLAKEQGKEALPLFLPVDAHNVYPNAEHRDFEGTMRVAGVYYGSGDENIYCSWDTLMGIWSEMGQTESATALHATLRDNDDLEDFRALMAERFAEPDPNADYSDWGLAMDIDDSQLRQADLTLRNSLRVNALSTMLVFLLSAGTGFLIGFLMIRSRKREIALMRTMGTPDGKIYTSFAMEQMLCVILGTAVGGGLYFWQPVDQLAVFVGIYFVGLTVALLIFLRSNLLTGIKQTE